MFLEKIEKFYPTKNNSETLYQPQKQTQQAGNRQETAVLCGARLPAFSFPT
jgi:hypothetical protein